MTINPRSKKTHYVHMRFSFVKLRDELDLVAQTGNHRERGGWDGRTVSSRTVLSALKYNERRHVLAGMMLTPVIIALGKWGQKIRVSKSFSQQVWGQCGQQPPQSKQTRQELGRQYNAGDAGMRTRAQIPNTYGRIWHLPNPSSERIPGRLSELAGQPV